MRFPLRILTGLIVLQLFALPPARAEDPADHDRVQWAAKVLTLDRDTDVVTAEGMVQVSYRKVALRADKVVYDRRADSIEAMGNVQLIDEAGNIATMQELAITGDLREGFIRGVDVFFANGERLAAKDGSRREGRYTTFTNVVYTPCDLCDPETGEDKNPLWHIRARRVVHDEKKRTLTYHDATLELFGVPIAYTPWLRHPDASVKRATGFLMPQIKSSSFFGFGLELPYYIDLAPNKDLTIAPLITSSERAVLNVQYRQRTKRGQFRFDTSGTYVRQRDDFGDRIDGNEWRGHVFGFGRFKLKNGWSWGWDVAAASDDTYLRRYDISNADSLTNRLFVERMWRRNYFGVNNYLFQGLRSEDISGLTPLVLPFVELDLQGREGWLNGRWGVRASLLMLTRTDGQDVTRGSFDASWRFDQVTPQGLLYTFTLGMRGDLYYLRDIPQPFMGSENLYGRTEVEGRAVPYAALEARMPFVQRGGRTRTIIEPIVMVVASPRGVNPDIIPNEDSISFEFDTSNLFEIDRFSGQDLWEGGVRVAYGLRFSHQTSSGRHVSLTIGQSYRFWRDDNFPRDSGLQEKLSDIVVGLEVHLPGLVDYYHRLRINEDDFHVIRNEATVVFGPKDYRFFLGYLDVDREGFDPSLQNRREIRTGAQVRLSQYWSTQADFSYDFTTGGGTLTAGAAIVYEDECLKFALNVRRDFTSDREVRPTTSVGIRLVFKVVGQ